MLDRITALKVVPNKPWESLNEVEKLRFANYARIDTSMRMRGLVERTYRKEHDRWVNDHKAIAQTIDPNSWANDGSDPGLAVSI